MALAVIVIVALALLLPSAFSAAQRQPVGCSAKNLVLEPVRDGTAGSFHDYLDLALRNAAPAKCVLAGYPRVQLLDDHANVIRVRVDRSRTYPARSVMLAPWQRVYLTLHYFGAGPCDRSISAFGLQIIPPGNLRRLVLYHHLDLCAPAQPTVDPVRARLGAF